MYLQAVVHRHVANQDKHFYSVNENIVASVFQSYERCNIIGVDKTKTNILSGFYIQH